MLEGIISDVLVRILGSYVDGLNRESIRVGVWQGDLELKDLRLRPDALAVLFESLGLDLPVTVTAGYIGFLRLEVPWKSLRSAPVRILMHDVTIVASPVSDGDQVALELRDQRLKAARLATDEAVRDAKFSVRAVQTKPETSTTPSADYASGDVSLQNSESSGNRVTRWGWRFTSKFVTKIVDNIQIDVENVVVQYEDASSVLNCPYTATLAFDSLRACSTDRHWTPVFIESPSSPVVHKLIYMHGLVLNWEPGNANNALKQWILQKNEKRDFGQWSGYVRSGSRHAIRPMDGQLKIALTKSSALASSLAGQDPALAELKTMPRVQMDLHFPDVNISLDDFQYHTLLSTIMYLSDIDRKVRPKTAKGRWIWALDRLLPRFKERRDAALRFNAEELRKRRELREAYCQARNAVVRARRNGITEPKEEADITADIERKFSYEDVILFRDIADRELFDDAGSEPSGVGSYSRFWSLFSRRDTSSLAQIHTEEAGSSYGAQQRRSQECTNSSDSLMMPDSTGIPNRINSDILTASDGNGNETGIKESDEEEDTREEEYNIPAFRMGFLLQKGAIQLKEGGHAEPPVPIASLEFHELRLGMETRPQAGFLLEALLGTFEVVDLRRNIKVMYPRVPWAGEGPVASAEESVFQYDELPEAPEDGERVPSRFADDGDVSHVPTYAMGSGNSSGEKLYSTVLRSYAHETTNAIRDIRGEFGLREEALHPSPNSSCTLAGLAESGSRSSSTSLSGLSDEAPSGVSIPNKEDLPMAPQTPLRYIAALRLNQEEVPEGEWAKGATRMAMDLAIGGMEVLIDGPKGAFISAVSFWHPREKMPSIMQFLSRAAAPRLASLRMDIQKALLERSVPMRMDILIRGPRFVIPGSMESEISLVLDFGTFAMETSVEAPQVFTPEAYGGKEEESSSADSVPKLANPLSIRYTNYKMAASDLGVYVVSDAGKKDAERIIRPFSVHLLLQVLNNSSYVEAVTLPFGRVDISKVKLQGKLPSLRTSVSHDAFRHILDIAKGWGERSRRNLGKIGIEPNRARQSVTVSAELEKLKLSRELTVKQSSDTKNSHVSPLVTFEMILEFQHLQLELRDSQARRVVTISTSGTASKLKKRPEVIDFNFSVRTFMVVDGSRGATAPFRQLAYAGTENMSDSCFSKRDGYRDSLGSEDNRAFIVLAYQGDLANHEQSLALHILSLNLVCVRETYFALADFFYLKKPRKRVHEKLEGGLLPTPPTLEAHHLDTSNEQDPYQQSSEEPQEYADPFNALGMTTSGAARALREQAGRGMELSKQAFANRGKLSLTADLDGLNLTMVTAEGAIASFDVSDCCVNLTQFSTGAVSASGELGGFGIRDLTSAFDVYSETVRYSRDLHAMDPDSRQAADGWVLNIPESAQEDVWLEAHLRNVRIVYLHRFIVILKKYFDVMRESLKPVLEMKGGIAEVFSDDQGADLTAVQPDIGRIRFNIITENVDVVMPRHSQSPYEALRFIVQKSSITNEDLAAPGYRIGIQIDAVGVNAHVLYQLPAEGEGRALTPGGTEPVLRQISPDGPVRELVPFSENICIVAKLDAWRRRKVPEVVLNADGIPVLKDGQEEREYDPAKWLPMIRVRISAPEGIAARLCEAEYSILYFTFTENIIERPDIEFTDIVRGLKTPILPARKPVQPIMFSSNRMPPNYQILFEVPQIDSLIMSGGDPRDASTKLIRTKLLDLVGCFEYGVDYRMTIEVNANVHSLEDARPLSQTRGGKLITPIRDKDRNISPHGDHTVDPSSSSLEHEMTRSVTLTWDRPFGFRANVMVVVSDLRIIVDPELFRDLGALTAPGYPFLKSSAPPPLLRFNGRLLILTISRPEVWLMANQYPGDGRSLVIRGDVIAKVRWAAVTGRNFIEVAANGIRINLSNMGPFKRTPISPVRSTVRSPAKHSLTTSVGGLQGETPMLYPADVSMEFKGRGYDPPENPDDEPVKAPGSALHITAESFLARLDVNDTPLMLAVGSRLVRLKPSALSRRPVQPGRFDQWIDKGEDGDAKLAIHFTLPQSRLMFTDETAGRYVPIMEARVRNATLRANVPWLTNAAFEFALDLFNEDKGWWEPGIESFPIEIATSKGRSGSQAIHIRVDRNVDVNVTPNTVYGAARVSRALKSAVEDLKARLHREESASLSDRTCGANTGLSLGTVTSSNAQRPSVAAFCVRNETGRSMMMWLPYDSKRRSLGGSGGEVEIETPSEELLWTAMSAAGGVTSDPTRNRSISMSCVLSLSGYEAMTLSTEHTGNRMVYFMPDSRDLNSPGKDGRSLLSPLALVWSVSMRDGVPCGCIRSVMRLVNRTRTLLDVNLGGLRKSVSAGSKMNVDATSTIQDSERPVHGSIKAGEAWCIPIYAVHRVIRIRPALFHAPDSEDDVKDDGRDPLPLRGRVYYSYRWSDPMSKISALHSVAHLRHTKKRSTGTTAGSRDSLIPSSPVLTCKSEGGRDLFCLTMHPMIDNSFSSHASTSEITEGWVDVHLCAPLVLTNLLPRPLSYKLAKPMHLRRIGKDHVFMEGYAEPLREVYVHGIGSDIENVALAVGMDNSSIPASEKPSSMVNQRNIRTVGSFHSNVPSLRKISTGAGNYIPLKVSLHHEQSLSTRMVNVYCQFWIRNRSDTDLFFRDKERSRHNQCLSPKVFLRGRPLGTAADPFVCFSGRWISFQQADTTEDMWVNVDTEVPEIDKPLHISLENVSLLLEVRPAKGNFQNALIVTIRNAVWLENRTGSVIQWCQPSALNSRGVALSSKVHTVSIGQRVAIHWDFHTQKKSVCLRRADEAGSSEWIWSRPVGVEGVEGEFAAKMYRPKREEQYIARVVVSRLRGGVSAIVVHREDRNTPPYRIVNSCADRSIAFRQSGVRETLMWLVRPGRTTRYSWDDPQAPVKKRSLLVEVIETNPDAGVHSVPPASMKGQLVQTELLTSNLSDVAKPGSGMRREKKFELNIDVIGDCIPFSHQKKFVPELLISVHVDGPTKVVTFTDKKDANRRNDYGSSSDLESGNQKFSQLPCATSEPGVQQTGFRNVDIVLFINALGISFVESAPAELAYLSVNGLHFRLDRFDGQQLIECQVQDLQLDNQLAQCTWPVVLWSPPPSDYGSLQKSSQEVPLTGRGRVDRKPFFQFTLNGPYPAMNQSIMSFHGIFMALQQLQIAADEDFVLRVWLFVVSLLDAAGGSGTEKNEPLSGRDGYEKDLSSILSGESRIGMDRSTEDGHTLLNRLYVENLELCPLKFTISFTSSRTSTAAEHIGGFRSLIRTLVAVLGNVENAEFRFNALELHHLFDTTSHFFSLIAEYYISQVSNQKMVLLASNSLMGNPSALFDSIAIGTRDFFVEPANAKGSADFIASIGRGSSSLLTNTVGGLVGSLGGIPRAVAQGLETAVGDREYLAERDSIRGGRARIVSSPAQGLFTGALSFGHGIASGAAGLIRDPLQGAAEDGPSGFIKGLGKGFIGGVLKPITGALDLIAEPAAGFRSMMVSDRSKSAAEPARPPRAFRGQNADQMTTYDLKTALGRAILQVVNHGENDVEDELLLAWTHLVGISSTATNEEVISFLWALMRRSIRSSNFQSKFLLDAHGNPQRADKMRAGLVTNKRVVIASLEGHVLWDYPLHDIVDTQVSLEAKDFLMIGVRPVGHDARTVVAPSWKKIHCGSMACRDELNGAIRKALEDLRTALASALRPRKADAKFAADGSVLLQDIRRDHRRDGSVEMVDMSTISDMNVILGNATELKSFHHDASVDGRRGIFTDMKLPGREGNVVPEVIPRSGEGLNLSQQLQLLSAIPSQRQKDAVRSVRVFVLNSTAKSWRLMRTTLESGEWVKYPPDELAPHSAIFFEADGTKDRVKNVSGLAVYCLRCHDSMDSSQLFAVRFLNPLLAANAYAVEVPDGLRFSCTGGEKGDHVVTTVTIMPDEGYERLNEATAAGKRTKPAAEPLLFGRSEVPPYLPPIKYSPPHAPKPKTTDPTDPELIAKLCSLGFSEQEARDALEETGANLSKAYSKLQKNEV